MSDDFAASFIQTRCKEMPTHKLTDALLRKAERPSAGVLRFWDTEIKGFVAHVQKTTTTLYYDRNNQRHLIGRYPTVSMPPDIRIAYQQSSPKKTRSNPTF